MSYPLIDCCPDCGAVEGDRHEPECPWPVLNWVRWAMSRAPDPKILSALIERGRVET